MAARLALHIEMEALSMHPTLSNFASRFVARVDGCGRLYLFAQQAGRTLAASITPYSLAILLFHILLKCAALPLVFADGVHACSVTADNHTNTLCAHTGGLASSTSVQGRGCSAQ